MKTLFIAVCVAGLLMAAGCSDTADIDGNGNAGNNGNGGNNGGGNANNLQTFVLANCNGVTAGEAMGINGGTFPPNSETDPTQSVYSRNCLDDVN